MKTKSVTIQTPDATSRVEHKRLPDVKTPNANSMLHNCPCKITSVYIAASLAVLVLAAIAFTVAMTTKNWSASGTRMRMGLWDYCIIERGNITWTCHPVNTGERAVYVSY
ncbi:hypothetical protein DPMN_084655 [Dreissena polymorpha]|uniref:Uncharacterized protein n=1 Tax=Dreissena polymorpha TaxID=45954 RepID=A0A9D3YE81_DREPO|nr:hypothetical protein DPMN_084655 [Dreissena polymorpha]